VAELFTFHVSPVELIVRGSLSYWFLFLVLRFVLRRDAGSVGLADILLIVLVADAAQNGMTGEAKSVAEAFLVIGTIVGWNYGIDWMSYRYGWFARFSEPSVRPLVRHGRLLRHNLEREMITEDELHSQLRQNGIEHLWQVKHARLEPDGKISVIRADTVETKKKTGGPPGAG
jgi:uncharacterized membrane protein YcaP (DUF421 family)